MDQKIFLTILALLGVAGLTYGDELNVAAPISEVAQPVIVQKSVIPGAVVPVVDVPAAAVITPAIAPTPIVPVSRQPTGETTTTEHRSPDGSVITITKYSGQFPQQLLPNYPGLWSPMPQYGQILHPGFYNPFYHN